MRSCPRGPTIAAAEVAPERGRGDPATPQTWTSPSRFTTALSQVPVDGSYLNPQASMAARHRGG